MKSLRLYMHCFFKSIKTRPFLSILTFILFVFSYLSYFFAIGILTEASYQPEPISPNEFVTRYQMNEHSLLISGCVVVCLAFSILIIQILLSAFLNSLKDKNAVYYLSGCSYKKLFKITFFQNSMFLVLGVIVSVFLSIPIKEFMVKYHNSTELNYTPLLTVAFLLLYFVVIYLDTNISCKKIKFVRNIR